MNKQALLLAIIIWLFITKCYSQCENNKYYTYYQDLILKEKGIIQKLFDELLDKYGDVYNVLKDLLSKLNDGIDRADSKLLKLEISNKQIHKMNNKTRTDVNSLLEKLTDIRNDLSHFNSSRNLLDEFEEADDSSKKTLPRLDNFNITDAEENLKKWENFLNGLDDNYGRNIMNLPHKIFEELDLLEKLVAKENDSKCFDDFHEKLKSLFIELANLFDLTTFEDDIDNIKTHALQNKDNAEAVLSHTNTLLTKEKELKDMHLLANETLILAKQIENLKKSISNLSNSDEKLKDDKLKKIQEEHEMKVRQLENKYDVKKGRLLLKQLEDTKKQIENVYFPSVEEEIDYYLRDINYYACILENCENRRKGIVLTENCSRD